MANHYERKKLLISVQDKGNDASLMHKELVELKSNSFFNLVAFILSIAI